MAIFLNSLSNGGEGSVDYSLDEQNTGVKWIDGRDIYVKTYEYVYERNDTGINIRFDNATDLTKEAIIDINVSFSFLDAVGQPPNYVTTMGYLDSDDNIGIRITYGTGLQIYGRTANSTIYSGTKVYLTKYYVKKTT